MQGGVEDPTYTDRHGSLPGTSGATSIGKFVRQVQSGYVPPACMVVAGWAGLGPWRPTREIDDEGGPRLRASAELAVAVWVPITPHIAVERGGATFDLDSK